MEVSSHDYLQIPLCSHLLRNQHGMVFFLRLIWSRAAAPGFQVYQTLGLYRGIAPRFQSCRSDALLKQLKYVFSVAREVRRFPSALEVLVSSIAILRLLSLCCVGFCLYSKEACARVYPKRLCSELSGLPPSVSHHCFWLSPLTGNERFILSGLNYIVPS